MSWQILTFTSLSVYAFAVILQRVLLRDQKSDSIAYSIFLRPSYLSKMLLMCLLYAISSVTFFIALQIGNNSSQIAVINLLSVILIVILSAIFLKERGNIVRKLIGAILSIIGSYILIR